MKYRNKFFSIRVLIPFILQSISWPIMRLLFGIFARFEVRGRENLRDIKNTGVIFAANHSSEWDPVLITGALSWMGRFTPLFYVSLQKEYYNNSGYMRYIYGGLFFRAWGAYPAFIGLKDYEKSLRHHINILNSGRSLCFFPEGKKTRDGSLGETKNGVAYLAQKTKTPVVPVGITGVFNIKLTDFLLRRMKIVIKFGKPIYNYGNNEQEDFKISSRLIMKEIKDLLNVYN